MTEPSELIENALLNAVREAVEPTYYLSLSTEEPTKTDSHEVSSDQYARIKWEGSDKPYTWPTFIYESEPYYE